MSCDTSSLETTSSCTNSSCPCCQKICIIKPDGECLDFLLPTDVKVVRCIDESCADVLVVVGQETPVELRALFAQYRCIDNGFDTKITLMKNDGLGIPVIYSPLVKVTDYHDVRVYHEAAGRAFKRVVDSGFKNPLLMIPPCVKFNNGQLLTVLGALQALYVPLQVREMFAYSPTLVEVLWILVDTECKGTCICRELATIEPGRFVFRDIAMADPERLTPIRTEDYVYELFKAAPICLEVICETEYLAKEFPLFHAVNRAAHTAVKRHQGRILLMEFVPPCTVKKTLMLVGKGVTFDTGGVNLRIDGSAGMSRSKSGAALVVGFMQITSIMRPRNIHVVGALALTRNAVGEEAYVPDEIIRSRGGIKVRINNTDAEGRLVMSDPLTFMKEQALGKVLPCPHLFTIGAMTRHARTIVGNGYPVVMDNSVARLEDHGMRVQYLGTEYGEPHEISLLRKDDFDANIGKIIGEQLVQSPCCTHKLTFRAHQILSAFMLQNTKLTEHDLDSCYPLKVSHFDIAGTVLNYPELPASGPLITMAKVHLYEEDEEE